ncbi:MAG TPA: TetR/AcrR family transcriptional regulator [Kofleriaceae bacterium]|nr:TetR/AcrR family transcriptional regulator [Kofleriaceae bacterium]
MADDSKRRSIRNRARSAGSTYHHGDLRRALIDGALAIVAEPGGAEALTLREVARRAGVTHAAPYRHFENKDQLLCEVAEEGFRKLTDAMAARAARVRDSLARYRAIGTAYVEFAAANPGHYRVMFGARLDHGHPGLAEAAQTAFDTLVGAIVAGQKAGQLRSGSAMEMALTSWSAVHGLAMIVIDGRLAPTGLPGKSPTALARSVVRLLADGMAAR